ncbi:hypothetical protein EV193_104380 [Herbihabitans rhizosphaerae]|uniref:Uncharacterized protein n=1 Tax=Herbihabitans rhizosphaerae TaxID=1872711 RepID=A0A4Q7KRL6_9PSEU|nr:hypothetical protein [Herbihabitans rhizosphaerae]RZS39164.1 hypothetical protein EV193_104380 [Herbihabitans rhizosphaerae]
MATRTVYTISGESTEKPENLPAGFTVEERAARPFEKSISVDDDPDPDIFIRVSDGGYGDLPFRIEIDNYNDTSVYFSRAAARELCAALGELLGDDADDGTPNRVLVDGDGGTWFEVVPDLFVYNTTYVGAKEAHTWGDGRSYQAVEDSFGVASELRRGQ